jgi:hypothetical protein
VLDPDHPDTDATIAIAHADDAVLAIAKRMTLVSSPEKPALLDAALRALDEMERIARRQWNGDAARRSAIDLLRDDIRALAALESRNDFVADPHGKVCTVCASAITSLPGYPNMTYCAGCLQRVARGREAVSRAFHLWAI